MEIKILFNLNKYVKYSNFMIINEVINYIFFVSNYFGIVLDCLKYYNGMSFFIKDCDNDMNGGYCVVSWIGVWWYRSCVDLSLNSNYGDVYY